jgi:hypothetical protein
MQLLRVFAFVVLVAPVLIAGTQGIPTNMAQIIAQHPFAYLTSSVPFMGLRINTVVAWTYYPGTHIARFAFVVPPIVQPPGESLDVPAASRWISLGYNTQGRAQKHPSHTLVGTSFSGILSNFVV